MIRDDSEINIHAEELAWLNELMIDLKLQLLGREPHRPITLERLDEWNPLRSSLQECTQKIRKYYSTRGRYVDAKA